MKNFVRIIGALASIALVVVGCCVWGGMFAGDSHYSRSSYDYDKGYATFGNDYYTYTNNNMADIADRVQSVKYELDDMHSLLKPVLGAVLVFGGLMGACGFLGALEFKKKEQKQETASLSAVEAFEALPLSEKTAVNEEASL